MLLAFPPELVQLILQHTSTPAYLQAAFSCRTLFEIASTCREVVLHHLRETPGLNTGIDSQETKYLFRLLVKRSFHQLYGAQFYASGKLFNFEGKVINARASSLATSGHPNLALAVKGDEIVYLFDARDGDLSPRGKLVPPFDQPGSVEVLKTTFDDDNGIYVLQRFTPLRDHVDTDVEHPFVKHALQSPPSQIIYLVYHSLKASQDHVRICAFPDHADYEPLAFTVANRDAFAISWKHVQETDLNEVVLYTDLSESVGEASGIIHLSYKPRVIIDGYGQQPRGNHSLQTILTGRPPAHEKGPIVDLAFNDRSSQLLYYYRAQTLYGSFQRINMSPYLMQPKVYENSCMVQFSDDLNLLFSIGIPFFGTHQAHHAPNNPPMCHWKYLALGIAKHREENWTVACVLKSEALCRAINCEHVLNLERGRRFSDWNVVARLWGFQDSNNSLGCKVATSSHGTRIAVANWNVIYVWSVEPNELIEENASGFYPSSSKSASSGMIELRPIVLQLDAVCFKLSFLQEEDHLVAQTDRGVMYWDLGPLGKGARTVHKLVV